MDYRVSDTLKGLLNRRGLTGATAATVDSAMMKFTNDLIDRAEVADDFRPDEYPRVRIYRARPFLAAIDGGKLGWNDDHHSNLANSP